MAFLMAKFSKWQSLRISLFISLISMSYCAGSQSLTLVDSATVNSPDLISIDQSDNIYISDVKGNVYKFGSNLNKPLVYSPDKPAKITFLETWQGLRIFCFYRDIQEFALLNRFLNSSENYLFDLPEIQFAVAATTSFDNNLWILDQPSMSLLKYNISSNSIEFTKPLDLTFQKPFSEIILFREYQNRIYLIDKQNGIFIFDNLGNFISNEKLKTSASISFFENYLYYLENGRLIFKNLYSSGSYNIDLPKNRTPNQVVRNSMGIYLLEGESVYFYRIN